MENLSYELILGNITMSASQDSQEGLLDQEQAETIIEEDAEPSSNYPKKMRKTKRITVTSDFTEEQGQDMVDWLQDPEQECIFNKNQPNYIKTALKNALWEQKAKEIEKNSDQSKKWYANMRTRFGKIKHTPLGSARPELTSRDKWIVQRFQFLKPYLTVHNKKISYGVSSFGVS